MHRTALAHELELPALLACRVPGSQPRVAASSPERES